MLGRRHFLTTVAAGVAAAGVESRLSATAREIYAALPHLADESSAASLPQDERYWQRVRRLFDMPPGVVNLDNGNISPASRQTIEAVVRASRETQPFPVTGFRDLGAGTAALAEALGRLLGVSPTEVALVRNATEALDTVLLGYTLQPGDEIVCSAHDYYAMRDAIEQRRRRDGVIVRVVQPAVPLESEDDLVAAYERELTSRSRLVLVTHPSNLTGQLAPVRRIADAAHRAGAVVAVDGAQSMALVPYTMADLGCDFFGASFHKWLMAPVGWGVLWMRPELMERTWPLVPPPAETQGTMRQYSRFGTVPAPLIAGLLPALALHERIGTARKAARLRHLTARWRERVEPLPGVRFYTTNASSASCGIATVEVKGVDPTRVEEYLWTKERILVQAIDGGVRAPDIKGIRITPSIATMPEELDRFAGALARMLRP